MLFQEPIAVRREVGANDRVKSKLPGHRHWIHYAATPDEGPNGFLGRPKTVCQKMKRCRDQKKIAHLLQREHHNAKQWLVYVIYVSRQTANTTVWWFHSVHVIPLDKTHVSMTCDLYELNKCQQGVCVACSWWQRHNSRFSPRRLDKVILWYVFS